ncbi:uncharacterized protein LOC115890687 [Sitophilus oryzae]|uniref:Uncharacterized protein LOC115890687 n=1 Tax=Sitophilus oryzae TaxID=7048 RepID=A0A6J2YRY8_SITOR|nr:uncharacterized protein LOC115890687 [Sitophilus oryzae]
MLQPPIMGDIPAVRLSQVKPFSEVGCDYGGPFSLLRYRARGDKSYKAYICLFVCMATKALHLELVSDLSSETFLVALRRFISRRGRCNHIYSDCGTNFVGASRELINMLKSAAEQEQISWHFNPPSAPHFGDLWEAGIKSVKLTLKRVIGDQLLTNERSIIDYILISRHHRNDDVRVRREVEINSDHYLTAAETRIGNVREDQSDPNQSKRITLKKLNKNRIRVHRLNDTDIARKYQFMIKQRLCNVKTDQMRVEDLWTLFKTSILITAEEVCGISRDNKTRKQTAWWSKNLKEQVKCKKQRWKEYLQDSTEQSYNLYKEQRNKVKLLIKEAKNKSWEEFGNKMLNDYHANQKLFYRVLKNLKTGNQQSSVKQIGDSNGNLVTNEQEIIKCWKEYFQKLLCTDDVITNSQETELASNINTTAYRKIDETVEAIKMLKKGKAAGHDNITGEMLKNLGESAVTVFTDLLNKIINEEEVPRDWELGIILPIFKKGDKTTCVYRGITLLSIPSKVFERILEQRLKGDTDELLDQAQSDFRKGRSVQDHIFTLKQMAERIKVTGKNIYVAFLDIEKAFVRVPRQVVCDSLKKRSVHSKLKSDIVCLYKNTRNYDTSAAVTRVYAGYRNLQPIWIKECAFADDLAILANSEKELKRNLEIWLEREI